METLKQHDKRKSKEWANYTSSQSVRNGIKCPKCKSELYDTTPNILLLSAPPRFHIDCLICNFHGTRIA